MGTDRSRLGLGGSLRDHDVRVGLKRFQLNQIGWPNDDRRSQAIDRDRVRVLQPDTGTTESDQNRTYWQAKSHSSVKRRKERIEGTHLELG